uniref:Uncharacterized protein n=1 Tax=Podarcis muralis TaxID=64176 RepID=A0A670KM16_PODMU
DGASAHARVKMAHQLTSTCFSINRMVSSDVELLAFLVWLIASARTLRSDSFALFVSCFPTVTRFSLCSRVTLVKQPSASGFRFIPLSRIALIAAAGCPRTSGKLLMLTRMSCGDFREICPSWLKGNFPSLVATVIDLPGEVRMLRFLLKSSCRVLTTERIFSFTSSKPMISSTREVLMFTRAPPFPLAGEAQARLFIYSEKWFSNFFPLGHTFRTKVCLQHTELENKKKQFLAVLEL